MNSQILLDAIEYRSKSLRDFFTDNGFLRIEVMNEIEHSLDKTKCYRLGYLDCLDEIREMIKIVNKEVK